MYEEINGKSKGNSLESAAIVSMFSPNLCGFFLSFFSVSVQDFYQIYSMLEAAILALGVSKNVAQS